ncbi:MAG: NAD-dependent epimerase/dehydratase family protein [bacterium]
MGYKRILITGSGGFVGKNLIRGLAGDYEMDGIDLPGNHSEGLSNFYNWSDLGNLPVYDFVIHLAGKAHDLGNTSKFQTYFDINLGLTQKIFDWFIASGSGKFIFFSSVKAVADTVNSDTLTEDVLPGPKTPYGKSKLAAENYILDHKLSSDRFVYILRPCMIHGLGNKGNLNLLYNYLSKGLPYPLGSFENLRSFLSVSNLTWVIAEIIQGRVTPGIYNLADDEPVSTNELIKLIAEVNKKKPRIWNVPAVFINNFAKAGDALHLPFNSERLKKLTESYIVSNVKLKNALKVKNLPVSTRNGLIQTFEYLAK